MGWIRKKLESLAGTFVAVVSGLTALQLPAFINAYLQRLGGHLDEARLRLIAIKTVTAGQAHGGAAVHDQLVSNAQARIDYLETAQAAITAAGQFEKPIAFFRHLDGDIALAAAQSYTPALPLDVPSLVYAVAGIVLGWLVWGVIKAPARLFRRTKRHAERA